MKALVTGANGLVGANLVRELLREGAEVRGLVRASSQMDGIAGLPIDLAFGDVLDPLSLGTAVTGQDVVFHTAVPFSYWGHELAAMSRTATEGSGNLLAAAAVAGRQLLPVHRDTPQRHHRPGGRGHPSLPA